jgi:hypothetical protein
VRSHWLEVQRMFSAERLDDRLKLFACFHSAASGRNQTFLAILCDTC